MPGKMTIEGYAFVLLHCKTDWVF